MDWQNILGTAAVIIALASAAAIGGMRGTLANLRQSNTDLRDRNKDLEAERDRDRAEKAELRTQVATLTHDTDVLRSAVSGHTEFVALSDQIEDVARTVNNINKTLTEAFKELP